MVIGREVTQKCVNPDEPLGNQAHICKLTFYGTLKSPIVKTTNLNKTKIFPKEMNAHDGMERMFPWLMDINHIQSVLVQNREDLSLLPLPLRHVRLSTTPQTTIHQASLSFITSRSLLRFMSTSHGDAL